MRTYKLLTPSMESASMNNMEVGDSTRAQLQNLAQQVESKTQISPQGIETADPATKEMIDQNRETARMQVADFFATFPQIPLKEMAPFTRRNGEVVDVPTYPLVDAMQTVHDSLAEFNGGDYAQDRMREIADIVIQQKRGDDRLPDEVEGKWNESQEIRFKRLLAFGARTHIVPEGYAKLPFEQRAREFMRNMTTGTMFLLGEIVKGGVPPDTSSNQTPPSSIT